MSEESDVVVYTAREADELISAGGKLQRNAHQMRLPMPVVSPDNSEFHPFLADSTPPLPWVQVLPAFAAAYPPDHPDHLPGGDELIESYLVPYTAGAKLGALLCRSSAIAIREGHAYGGILIVDRPGEGAWVCDVWRHPHPEYAGTGAALLRWAASRLEGFESLSLVVTVGNDRALRAYERVGFIIESTAWTIRLP